MKSVLGRGVDALLANDTEAGDDSRFFMCDIDKIQPNKQQPRSYFDEEKLNQLADSIREKGIIQPLLVTKAKGNRYHLIAGERRLRAARMVSLDEVPVVVMEESSNNERLELALIENIQRHDLNPIEEAIAYARLIDEFKLTQEEVAKKVGRKRSTITNVLRLLTLPESLQGDLIQSIISEGHARVLLRLKDNPEQMQEVRERIVQEDLSVRATEQLCKKVLQNAKENVVKAPIKPINKLPKSYCKTLTTQMTNHLNTKVRIVQNGERGKLEIEYYSSDDLDRLTSFLTD